MAGKATLDGSQAVARLERRGGQVWVFRMGYGSVAAYMYAGRKDGATVVLGPEPNHRRWVLRTDLDRKSLAHDMEAATTLASASADASYTLVHRDELDADAGYGQVGCVLVLGSLVVGLIVGLMAAWIATGEVTLAPPIVGVVIGFVVGFYGDEPLASAAVLVPYLRDRVVNLAYLWCLVVPAVTTAITIVVASLIGM